MGESGHSLKAAASIAEGKAPKKGKDWAHILVSFKDQKINFGTAITEAEEFFEIYNLNFAFLKNYLLYRRTPQFHLH